MLHIWHEDKYIENRCAGNTTPDSATQQFYCFLRDSGVSPKLANSDIRGFNSISNMYDKIVLNQYQFNKNDKYILFADCVPDNPTSISLYRAIKKAIRKFPNVYLSNILCFEYLLLSFRYFNSWTYPKVSRGNIRSLYIVKNTFVNCIKKDIVWETIPLLQQYLTKYNQSPDAVSSEKMSYYILLDIQRVSQFKYGKTFLGDCWFCDCCIKRVEGKRLCSLYSDKSSLLKTSKDKASTIFNHIGIKSIINRYG